MFEVYIPKGRLPASLRQAVVRLAILAITAGLGGCNRDVVGSTTDLFHGLEGGAIAEQRPPPPGADAPYPNLGTIPARPPAPDVAAQQRIADRLAAQRDASTVAAAASPLTVVTQAGQSSTGRVKQASPGTTSPDPGVSRVVVDAAATPSPAAVKPPLKKSDPTPVTQAALPDLTAVPAIPAAVTAGPTPDLAEAAPAAPAGLGVDIPASPVSATPLQTSPPPEPPPTPGSTVMVAFTPGSAVLPPSATLNLRRFALAHKGAAVTITGHGEAVLPGADAQSRALDLALRRAQAIAVSLGLAGVTAANLHLYAEAAGQGGTASL